MDIGLPNPLNLEVEDDGLFTLSEFVEMKNLYKEKEEQFINKQFCEELATKFSSSVHRHGKAFIRWQQVYGWFIHTKWEGDDRISSEKQKPVGNSAAQRPVSLYNKRLVALLQKRVEEDAFDVPSKPIGEMISELSDLEFEARSAKDFAWYDVAAFINYRITSAAEIEVRVRFAGFDKDNDEWINVKWGIRQRSVPLESSECEQVKVGDVVLCFRVNERHAVYLDAYVVGIERKPHEGGNCRCTFVVRYDCDDVEEKVQLYKLCSRPS